MTCRICGNGKENKTCVVKEMMFGYRDEFKYRECAVCGCLQIEEVPADMSKYYPEGYYSFSSAEVHLQPNKSRVKRYLEQRRTNYVINRNDFVGRLVSIINPAPPYLIWMKKCNANLDSRVLDVGCGAGHLLGNLRRAGFKNLTGIDLYVKGDIIYENWISIYKKEIFRVEDSYDTILFNHSFEHMPDPLRVLRKVCGILNAEGRVLLRIPTVSSDAWRQYGVDWVGIDAPRHFFLHSLKSIEMLATEAGLTIKEIVHDFEEVHYWGSEQYRKDIPLFDERSVCVNPSKSIFSKNDIRSFKKRSEEVGGQVSVFLAKA